MRGSRELGLAGGRAATVTVVARRGQRRLRLTVGVRGGLRCSVPAGTSEAEVDRFLAEHAAWAERVLADWRRRSTSLVLRDEGLDEREVRLRARRQADALIARPARELGVSPGRIRIGDPTSRWGSASSRGSLSFSFRLTLAPPWVFEYVVCHEVAHLRELNHSAAFWALVDRLCPERRAAQRWLHEHGPALHAWAPAAPPSG